MSPAGTCLSLDANFTMVDGQGTFMGSICEQISAVTIKFNATSAITGLPLNADDIGPIEVTSKYMSYQTQQSSDSPHISRMSV